MIMAICLATQLMVMGFMIAENTKTGLLLVLIACLLFLFADYRYQKLKDRIEELEQKGGDSDA